MSWLRFAPKEYTAPHYKLCFGKGGLADHGISFKTEYWIDCGADGRFKPDIYIGHDLIVEVDGASHQREARRSKDAWKDAVLEKHGFRVLRVTEQQIKQHFDKTVKTIMCVCACRQNLT